MASFADTETGSTWSWLPAASAAAVAGLDEIGQQGILAHVADMVGVAQQALAQATSLDGVDDVRIHGALVGIEFSDRGVSGAVATEALNRGILVVATDTTVVLSPPLNLDLAEYRGGIDTVVAAAESILSH